MKERVAGRDLGNRASAFNRAHEARGSVQPRPSPRNDRDREMIPNPEMIPNRPRNDPDPEMIPTFLLLDPEMAPKE